MLLMAMRNKEDLLEEAVKYGVEIQVQSVYDSIESLLSQNYGLSEDGIKEVNSIKKERDLLGNFTGSTFSSLKNLSNFLAITFFVKYVKTYITAKAPNIVKYFTIRFVQ